MYVYTERKIVHGMERKEIHKTELKKMNLGAYQAGIRSGNNMLAKWRPGPF